MKSPNAIEISALVPCVLMALALLFYTSKERASWIDSTGSPTTDGQQNPPH